MADPPLGRVPTDEASGEMHKQRLSIAFAVALNEDQALSERDQTLADAEQTLSDADQAAADIDEAAADVLAIIRGMIDASGEREEADTEGIERRVRAAVFGYLRDMGAK